MGLVMLEEIVEQLVEPRFARIDAIGLEAALHQRLRAGADHRARVLEGDRGEPFADQQRVERRDEVDGGVGERAVEVEHQQRAGRGRCRHADLLQRKSAATFVEEAGEGKPQF